MKSARNWITAFLLLISCGGDLPRLEGVDLDKWKQDKNGCKKFRSSMEGSIRTGMSSLKGLSETNVLSMLGKPDQNELYRRNQKFYYYFLSPGPACGGPSNSAVKLSIRFNAMGYAQSVSIEGD